MAKKEKFVQTKRLPVIKSITEGFQLYKQNFLTLSKIILVVAIPVGLLQLVQTDVFNGDGTIVASIAWGFAILAMLLVLFDPKQGKVKLSEIYTKASGRFLQYVVISLFFIVFALPAIGAVIIFLILIPVYDWPGIFLMPVGLICILASIYLYCRYVLALPAIADKPISSFSAIALAGQMSKKNVLRIMGVLLAVLLLVVMVMVLVTILLNLSQALAENKLLGILINIVLSALLVPYILSVLVTVYKKLSWQKPRPQSESTSYAKL